MSSIILGYIESYPNPIPINTINMTTKSYIFYCSRNKLRLRIKTVFETHEFISFKTNRSKDLNRTWNAFKQLFIDDYNSPSPILGKILSIKFFPSRYPETFVPKAPRAELCITPTYHFSTNPILLMIKIPMCTFTLLVNVSFWL